VIDGGVAGGEGTQKRGTATGARRPERERADGGDVNSLNVA